MTWAGAMFVCATFLLLTKVFRVAPIARAVFGCTRRAVRDLRDPNLGDLERERAVRSHALRLLRLFVVIALAALAALALPLGLIALLDAAGVMQLDAVIALTTTPLFLLVATALVAGAALAVHARRP